MEDEGQEEGWDDPFPESRSLLDTANNTETAWPSAPPVGHCSSGTAVGQDRSLFHPSGRASLGPVAQASLSSDWAGRKPVALAARTDRTGPTLQSAADSRLNRSDWLCLKPDLSESLGRAEYSVVSSWRQDCGSSCRIRIFSGL